MNFTPEQKKQLETAEKEMGEKLTKLLTAQQQKQWAIRPKGFVPGVFPLPGQLMASSVEDRLKLTTDQKRQLAALQKQADGKLDALLRSEQKKQLQRMQDMARGFAGGGPGRFPAGPPGGAPGGPRGGAPGGFPGFGGGFGAPAGSGLFRAPRYAAEYAGLVGKDLTPGKTIEELEAASRPTPSAAPKDK
jgi:hypothetical protein